MTSHHAPNATRRLLRIANRDSALAALLLSIASCGAITACGSMTKSKVPPPDTYSEVGLRRAVVPVDPCHAELRVTWTPVAVTSDQGGTVGAFAVPPDTTRDFVGKPAIVAGQAVCDYVIGTTALPAPGRWRIEITGLALNKVSCEATLLAGQHNYHAFMANVQGCSASTRALEWPSP